jgi:hypothetical protein
MAIHSGQQQLVSNKIPDGQNLAVKFQGLPQGQDIGKEGHLHHAGKTDFF